VQCIKKLNNNIFYENNDHSKLILTEIKE